MCKLLRWLWPLAASVVLASPTTAAQPDFVALEAHLSEALARYDAKTADALWDDHLVFVFPNGRIAHKKEQLASLARDGVALINHNDAVEVVYEDVNVAVLIVRSNWRTKETDAGEHYIATHVWVRRGGHWRLVSAQVAQANP